MKEGDRPACKSHKTAKRETPSDKWSPGNGAGQQVAGLGKRPWVQITRLSFSLTSDSHVQFATGKGVDKKSI